MSVSNIRKHYQRMKKILNLIETGEWRKYPSVAKMSIEQIDNMRQTVKEFETLGIENPSIDKTN